MIRVLCFLLLLVAMPNIDNGFWHRIEKNKQLLCKLLCIVFHKSLQHLFQKVTRQQIVTLNTLE